MKDDIDTYEKDYLERFKKQEADRLTHKKEREAETARIAQEQRDARQKEKAKYASQTIFTVWDYVLLESIRRGDPRIRIRIGTMKVLTSLEKLFRSGWIEKPINKIPFDDMEKLETFRDSYEYKQYKNRLDRIMSYKDHVRKGSVLGMLGIKKIDDWLILTEEGKCVAREKRSKVRLVWGKLRKMYSEKSAEFQQAAEDNASYLPLFLVMGLVNGTMMAQMMSDAHIDYPYWYGDLYGGGSYGAWDGSGGFDGGFGEEFDFGGF